MKAMDDWKTLQRHPLSAQYPDISGKAWEQFVADLREHGVVNKRRIILHPAEALGPRMIIDGWQLFKGCLEAGIEPQFENLKLPEGMSVETWVEIVNNNRRHETQEAAMKRTAERRERVAAARREGHSLRAIAEEEGVSEKQIRMDLKVVTAEGSAVEPEDGKVIGRDGRRQPATKPIVLCSRCARVGAVQGCDACAVLQADARKQDPTGPQLPDRLKPFFMHVELFQQAVRLAESLANLFQEIEQTPAYIKAFEKKKRRDHSSLIRNAARVIELITPKRPCPECGGRYEPSQDNDPCKTCMDKGYQTNEEVAE
jgi:hypothetical protein